MRSAASAWPDASPQSRISSTATSGDDARASAASARHQPQPAYSAAPGADSNVTGRPTASASRASASPCTTTAGAKSLTTDRKPSIADLTFNRLSGFSSSGSCTEAGVLQAWRARRTIRKTLPRDWKPHWNVSRGWPVPRPLPPRGAADGVGAGGAEPAAPVDEIAARLDGLIDRLRAALSSSSGGKPA